MQQSVNYYQEYNINIIKTLVIMKCVNYEASSLSRSTHYYVQLQDLAW